MIMDEYFDLTDPANDVSQLAITEHGYYECVLINIQSGQQYKGFVLAKSSAGNRYTICETNFHRSGADGKYQPRLTIRRVDPELNNAQANANARAIRISFKTGDEGYREFWKMIFFLYGFKEIIDFGGFERSYHVISDTDLSDYINNRDNFASLKALSDSIDAEPSAILRSHTTIQLLKEYRNKLAEFINTNATETEVQNWLDEDEGKYRQSRCLIFGLEFIEFKREGSVSSKRFDVLTRTGSNSLERVLIELKGVGDNIFEIIASETNNDPSLQYKLHDKIARAVPQILGYRRNLNEKNAGDDELVKLGIISGKANIGKCIIVIGTNRENDDSWKRNRENLVRSLSSSLEIWTYTDLLNKLDATIKNLEENTTKEL